MIQGIHAVFVNGQGASRYLPVALASAGWLLARAPDARKPSVVIRSLVQSVNRNAYDPYRNLAHVLEHLAAQPTSHLDEVRRVRGRPRS